ncbi:hypothetical protein FOL47_008125 [Perkinsus chesapeaki]|uniref:Uncharacterized protein n=1 Tax=Perkinsus chesapeaki TaxID=330153 RepID=A0A7J6LG23_PERCH|nr:hypothetical protein FOL47_008125 [Perkinsus chesapeaki]
MLPGHRELRTRQCEPTKMLYVISSEKDLKEMESESDRKVFTTAELIEAGLQESPPIMFYEPGSEELAEFLGNKTDGTPSDNVPGKRHHSTERQIITPHSAVEEIDLSSWGITPKPRALLIGNQWGTATPVEERCRRQPRWLNQEIGSSAVIDEASLDELDIRAPFLHYDATQDDLDFVESWNASNEPLITIDQLLIAFDTWEKRTLDSHPVDQTTAMQSLESRVIGTDADLPAPKVLNQLYQRWKDVTRLTEKRIRSLLWAVGQKHTDPPPPSRGHRAMWTIQARIASGGGGSSAQKMKLRRPRRNTRELMTKLDLVLDDWNKMRGLIGLVSEREELRRWLSEVSVSAQRTVREGRGGSMRDGAWTALRGQIRGYYAKHEVERQVETKSETFDPMELVHGHKRKATAIASDTSESDLSTTESPQPTTGAPSSKKAAALAADRLPSPELNPNIDYIVKIRRRIGRDQREYLDRAIIPRELAQATEQSDGPVIVDPMSGMPYDPDPSVPGYTPPPWFGPVVGAPGMTVCPPGALALSPSCASGDLQRIVDYYREIDRPEISGLGNAEMNTSAVAYDYLDRLYEVTKLNHETVCGGTLGAHTIDLRMRNTNNSLGVGNRTQELLSDECERIHAWVSDAWRMTRVLKQKARVGEPLGWSGRAPSPALPPQPHMAQAKLQQQRLAPPALQKQLQHQHHQQQQQQQQLQQQLHFAPRAIQVPLPRQ